MRGERAKNDSCSRTPSAVLVLVVLISLLTAAPAFARVNADFFGVVPQGSMAAADFSRMEGVAGAPPHSGQLVRSRAAAGTVRLRCPRPDRRECRRSRRAGAALPLRFAWLGHWRSRRATAGLRGGSEGLERLRGEAGPALRTAWRILAEPRGPDADPALADLERAKLPSFLAPAPSPAGYVRLMRVAARGHPPRGSGRPRARGGPCSRGRRYRAMGVSCGGCISSPRRRPPSTSLLCTPTQPAGEGSRKRCARRGS